METQNFQVVCYYLFEPEEGVGAKSRLLCTKGALYRYPDFENARKLQSREETERYSKQSKGGLYINIVPPRTFKAHNGAYPHHAFIIAAPQKEHKKQSSMYDPNNIQKYSFGDMENHALLFVFSDDIIWDNTGKIKSGSVEVLVFGNDKFMANEIYQMAIKGEFNAELELLRKLAIDDQPRAMGEAQWKIRVNIDLLNLQEMNLPHLSKLANALKEQMQPHQMREPE